MDKRTLLAVSLSFLVIMLWSSLLGPKNRQEEPGTDVAGDPSVPAVPVPASTGAGAPRDAPPSALDTPDARPVSGSMSFPETGLPVRMVVETEHYLATFSSRGAALTSFVTRDYDTPEGEPLELIPGDTPMPVLTIDADGSGPLVPFDFSRTLFDATQRPGNGLETGELVFRATSENGIVVERRYRFAPDTFAIEAQVVVRGLSDRYEASQTLSWPDGLPITERHEKHDIGEFAGLVFVGEDVGQEKLGSFRDGGEMFLYEGVVHWAATRTKYFLSLLAVDEGSPVCAELFGSGPGYRLGYRISAPIAEGRGSMAYRLYVGPIINDQLVALDVGIEHKVGIRTMPLGAIFGWFAALMYKLMNLIHGVIPNYGVAILILAIVTKGVFFPLTRKSTQSMKAMADLKPQMDAMREKYKDDPQKMNAEVLTLYKTHGVNPLAGCLPLVVQMPVFMALYGVLRSAIELRQAPFLLWIQDLSAPDTLVDFGSLPVLPDQLHILPILMAGTTILMQQKTMMTDPRQRTLMYFMPVMMLFFFYSLPAGLNLYWTAQNLLAYAEQSVTKGRTISKAAQAA